jgi:RHS repeat-associated protein
VGHPPDWGNQYSIDIWANMTAKLSCDGTACPLRHNTDAFSASANSKNQFNTYQYDASGNMQNDQLGHAFSYDAENRPYSAGGVTYYYDGVGERIAKSTGKLYFFGTGSAPVLETDAAGAITNEYVFFNGKRVAMLRASDSTVHYYFADQIGSAVKVTNADGSTVEQWIEYHPYGEETVITDSLGQEYRFTGKEHDPETNLDYSGARYYGSAFGRFLTPDWAATPVPVPYAQMGIPQTLNLYSYVENNPITTTDPDGHCPDACVIEGLALEEFIALSTAALAPGAARQANQPGNNSNLGPGFFSKVLASAVVTVVNKLASGAHSSEPAKPDPATPAPASAEDSSKKVPNPNGSKGAPDHQQTADEEAAKMGPNGQREVRVPTPGGEKEHRVIDAAKVVDGRVKQATQVHRPNKNGTPKAREVRAAKDIEKATGVKPEMCPVRPCK